VLNRLLRSAIAELLKCAGLFAHRGAVEVMGHAIVAPGDGRIRRPANLPAEGIAAAPGSGISRGTASPCQAKAPQSSAGGDVVVWPHPQQPGAGGTMVPLAAASLPRQGGTTALGSGVAMGMTQQYLAGELSVLLGRVQAVTTTEAAGREAWSLRTAAEQGPIQGLGWVTVRALALTDRLCWDSLNRGDIGAFKRQATASAALREFGVCSGLLKDT
jgi:hypothetical protein